MRSQVRALYRPLACSETSYATRFLPAIGWQCGLSLNAKRVVTTRFGRPHAATDQQTAPLFTSQERAGSSQVQREMRLPGQARLAGEPRSLRSVYRPDSQTAR